MIRLVITIQTALANDLSVQDSSLATSSCSHHPQARRVPRVVSLFPNSNGDMKIPNRYPSHAGDGVAAGEGPVTIIPGFCAEGVVVAAGSEG